MIESVLLPPSRHDTADKINGLVVSDSRPHSDFPLKPSMTDGPEIDPEGGTDLPLPADIDGDASETHCRKPKILRPNMPKQPKTLWMPLFALNWQKMLMSCLPTLMPKAWAVDQMHITVRTPLQKFRVPARNLAAFDNLVSQCMLGAQVSDWLSHPSEHGIFKSVFEGAPIWNPPDTPLVTLAIADNDRRDVSEATLESLEPPAKKHCAGQTTQGLNDRAISV